MNKGFPVDYYLVHDILKSWNPIGVIGNAIEDEYISYISRILKIKSDKNELLKELKNIVDEMEVNVESSKLDEIANEINSLR